MREFVFLFWHRDLGRYRVHAVLLAGLNYSADNVAHLALRGLKLAMGFDPGERMPLMGWLSQGGWEL